MTIYRAAELKEQMLEALGAAPELELDLSHVAELDASGLQLLLLLKREAGKAGKPLRLAGGSQQVAAVMQLCGLGAALSS
jgi:anti-anti-sigma factor